MIGFACPDFVPLRRLVDGSSPGVDDEELARGVRGVAVGRGSAAARNLGKSVPGSDGRCGVPG